MTGPLRILFAGTPEIAVPSLTRLADLAEADPDRYSIVGLLTNPDRPSGRGNRLTPPPPKTIAQLRGIPVLQPERLNASAREAVAELNPNLLVVVAYGRIFGPRFLALFPRGGINMHPSLLPAFRGPSPLQAAILAGLPKTGITIQCLAQEMDAGDILLQRPLDLSPRETIQELHDRAASYGAELLEQAIRALAEETIQPVPQNHAAATYCHIIRKSDGHLTLAEDAVTIDRMVRAYTPWPGVMCTWDEKQLQLLEVEPQGTGRSGVAAGPGGPTRAAPGQITGVDNGLGILLQTTDGILGIRRLKLQSRKPLDWRSFVNGNKAILNARLDPAC